MKQTNLIPSYYFHLIFELYHRSTTSSETPLRVDILDYFTPAEHFDIFGSTLPTHRASTWATYVAPQIPPPILKRGKESQASLRSPALLSSSRSSRRPSVDTSVDSTHQVYDTTTSVLEGTPTDWRYDRISVKSIDMESELGDGGMAQIDKQAPTSSGLAMRGRYVPSNPKITEFGLGVVHLYRDAQQSPGLVDDTLSITGSDGGSDCEIEKDNAFADKDRTTLCIIAVPSYMTPSDLLGWVGEQTREQVSHFRLVRTARSNKYMVLLKFREANLAKQWQRDWNGKLFNVMEPENCHVVFVKSVQFQTSDANKDPSSFPDMTNDPFTPSAKRNVPNQPPAASAISVEASCRTTTSLTTKPAPPPTPSLIELPTCPVCLERMDETTGLATIFCQHVFHCACLQKWRGSGCPVCRDTQADPLQGSKETCSNASDDECSGCGSTANLWICLICGNVGCGRYDEAHAFAHYEKTSHAFAMDIATQHVWDYANDGYVHRLIQNKSDGKLVELPSVHSHGEETAPVDKMENISLEYTYLLTSQLDSQRMYFEEQVERAVDKASKASAAAERAGAAATKAAEQLTSLQASHDTLMHETLPSLERSKERSDRRADKFEVTARKMEKEWHEKDVINESLMDRIGYLEKQINDATVKNSDLQEQNRDLSFFISGMEKLKGQGEDVQEGTLVIANPPVQSDKKKRKGRK